MKTATQKNSTIYDRASGYGIDLAKPKYLLSIEAVAVIK